MKQRNERGLALILVMTVVLALSIIATPFVLSMILQERTGTSARYLSQADYGADGAKNYAIWRLMPSVDPLERRSPSGMSSSYTYDTDREFEVRLDEMPLSTKMHVSDPKGSIWGINVQDEQGKLNTKTCSIAALTNLASMVDSRVVSLKDYLTLYSGRDATWIAPQRIRQMGFTKGQPAGGTTVDNLALLGPKSRIRVTKPPMKPLETTVTGNSILGSGSTQEGFTTKDSIAAYVDGVVEVEQRHPVNINTAKRETLIAMWEGLNIYGLGDSMVDRRAAQQLATRFHGRETPRLEQFLLQLASTSINPNQKLAVALNAVCPNAAILNGSGSVGVCFKSYDVYTLEATSSMNNPSGSQVAGRGYREVVSVSPPLSLRRYCESQYDFNQMYAQLQTAMQNINPSMAMAGFPYGNRMLTYPRPYTQQCDTALKPQGAGNEAYITVLPAEDNRGEMPENQFEGQLSGNWDAEHCRSHFRTEMDGKKTGGPEAYDWKQFFAFNFIPEDDPPAATRRGDTGSGGFEMWAKWQSAPTSATLFDIKEQETTNRVTLRIENNELILTVADSTIPNNTVGGQIANGVAEIRWPNFKVSDDTWTHFAAYWKSNRFADMALLVDGFCDPNAKFMHYTSPGSNGELMTTLRSALTPTGSSVSLGNTGLLPTGNELTPLLIGDEVVLVDSKGNASLRGARGTQVQDHPSQVTVSLFGYSSKIRNGSIVVNWPPGVGYTETVQFDSIPRTAANSTYGFGASPIATVCGDKMDPVLGQHIDMTAVQIGVLTPDITRFPDQGLLRIEDEVVFYTGRSNGGVAGTIPPSNAKFTGVVRADLGTSANIHRSGVNCEMFSVAVTDFTGFKDRSIIQVGDEWFLVRKDPKNRPFFVGFTKAAAGAQVPVEFIRGYNCLWSIPQDHSAMDVVTPTFLLRDVNALPSGTLASAGAWDRVTILDASNNKATAQIRRTSTEPRPQGVAGWSGSFNLQGAPAPSQVAAFFQPVNKDWPADDEYSRLLKFPSGELLSRNWLETASPKVSVGVAGQVDEIKAFAGSKGRFRLLMQGGVGDNTLQINFTNLPIMQKGGLMKIGDEFVGFGNWNNVQPNGSLTTLKRGWLNSTAVVHDKGDPIFYIPWIPVGSLSTDVSQDERFIRLNGRMSGDPKKYTSGYVLIDNEMIFFPWTADDGATLIMPNRFDGQRGLYRGMFGTTAQNHSSTSSLVYGMPFRYFDTYKAKEFDNTMVYFQWGQQLDLARWNSYLWRQQMPTPEKNIKVHGMARIDGLREFWDPPAKGELIDSTSAGGNLTLNATGHRGDAGQFDFRAYIEYPPNSFDAQNMRSSESWKRCPKITEVQVEYDRPCQTLHHEDY